MANFPNTEFKPKTFWQKPEGTTGAVFLMGIIGALGYVLFKFSAQILAMLSNTIGIVALLAIKTFIGFITKYGFKAFGWYRIALGSILILLLALGYNLQIV